MSGRVSVENGSAGPPGKHDHFALVLDDGVRVTLTDPRRFGLVVLVPRGDLESHRLFVTLGPEPLSRAFDGPALEKSFAGSTTSAKAALSDQRRIAGLGNIYVCEALFYAGLSPKRPAGTIRGRKATALAAAIKQVLRKAIARGGSSLRDYAQPSGELGYFQHHWAVYDREGKACPGCVCDVARTGGIRRIVQGGRSTFYCPRRQR
jgi:formamidopyrimidine-DNA glycosylase